MSGESVGDELARLLVARRGHFRLESGHHGRAWLDLDGLFLRPARTRRFAAALAGRLAGYGVEAVCGPLVGGAFLAQAVAAELDAEFYFAERFAEGPVRYRVPDALRPAAGKRVAVVDDVINAGSAVRGTVADLSACGGRLVAVGALVILGESADRLAAGWGVPAVALARRPNDLWEPAACPLCAAGEPLESG